MIRACLLFAVLLTGPILPAQAQPAAPAGLLAEYYEGRFERRLLVRRDATINFDWTHRVPAPGVPPEYFSVRWTGTLLPPATGQYVFHITVDDGMRVWLDDKLLFDEWREQPVARFTAAATLVGGRPYRLRVEYFNSILDTRARLTWERPDRPPPEPSSLANGYGLFQKKTSREEVIAGRFLAPPRPVLKAPVVAAKLPKLPMPQRPAADPPPAPRQNPVRAATGGPVPGPPARSPVVRASPSAARPTPPAVTVAADTAAARVASLADGQAVPLPELLFVRGSAALPPSAYPALDALAAALRPRPALRLRVEGHTDNIGNAELNRQLSQQRATAACLYLTAHGVPVAQLRPVGYGGIRPVADNSDSAQRPRNRRVVLVAE